MFNSYAFSSYRRSEALLGLCFLLLLKLSISKLVLLDEDHIHKSSSCRTRSDHQVNLAISYNSISAFIRIKTIKIFQISKYLHLRNQIPLHKNVLTTLYTSDKIILLCVIQGNQIYYLLRWKMSDDHSQ